MTQTFRLAEAELLIVELIRALKHVRTTLDNVIGDSELSEAYLPPLLQDVNTTIEAAKKKTQE